ncbi:serine/threonine protein kinase [Chloroflexota bacterium]
MKNPVGQIFLRQYRVDAFVAAGGMGAIYRVWDLKRNVYLAMKILHTDLADDPSILKRFRREARALKKLAHPNIVPFYGLYETQDTKFLLEAYIDGCSLEDILKSRPGQPFPVVEALTYLKAMSAALGYAHSKRVIHCDVKPGNVLVDGSGKVYLTDFGIARHAESTTTTFATAGTAAYMAPEQIRGESVSAETDVYALGVLLFELLTGKRPFFGDEKEIQNSGTIAAEKIRYAHLTLPPPNPSLLNPLLQPELGQMLIKALAKDPRERYASVLDMYAAVIQTVQDTHQFVGDQVPLSSTFQTKPDSPDATSSRPKSIPQKSVPWIAGFVIILIIISMGLLGLLLNRFDNIGIQSPSLKTPTIPSAPIQQVAVTSALSMATDSQVPTQKIERASTSTLQQYPSSTSLPSSTASPVVIPTESIVSQLKPTYFPLANCSASRLYVGDWAYIAFGGGRNAIRSKPDVGDKTNKIGYAEEGEVLSILGGPVCSYNWVVWDVQSSNGIRGWTPEGDESEYWLVPGFSWKPCNDAPLSRLKPEQFSQVSQYPDVPNNVRQNPDADAMKLGQIMPNEIVKIREGPVCADDMVWWRVRSQSSDLAGWTAEGDRRNYWLVPLPGE